MYNGIAIKIETGDDLMLKGLFKHKKATEKPTEGKTSVEQLSNAFGDFILQMKELSEGDESVNVNIESSFNTTVEIWSDDDMATGDIDFSNIQRVEIASREMTYRIKIEEEFDHVMSGFLSELDGWQHYETEEVEYEVPNGYEYTFLIYYKNGKKELRVYHEASPIAAALIDVSENPYCLNDD